MGVSGKPKVVEREGHGCLIGDSDRDQVKGLHVTAQTVFPLYYVSGDGVRKSGFIDRVECFMR